MHCSPNIYYPPARPPAQEADARTFLSVNAALPNLASFAKAGNGLHAVMPAPAPRKFVGDVTSCSTASDLGKNFVPSTNVTDPVVGEYLGLTFDFDLAQVVSERGVGRSMC